MQKDRTKILYVITKSNFGGAQRYVYDLATTLPPEAYEVKVISGGKGTLTERLTERNIPTISIPYLARDINIVDEVRSFFDLLQIFRTESPDIVHLNSSKIGGLGALAGRIHNLFQRLSAKDQAQRANIVFTVHGWPFNENRPHWQKSLIRILSWMTALLSHTVITVSERDMQQGKQLWGMKDTMVHIYNGIATPDFLPQDKARAELNIPSHKTVVGSLGELHTNKGFEYAIKAVARAIEKGADLTYCIIGDGEEKTSLKRQISSLHMEDHIHIIPPQGDDARFLRAFDIFLLPSTKEGFPYVLLEAGYAGLPVIASRVGGIPEVIVDNQTGVLVPPGDVDALTEELTSLATNPDTRPGLANKLSYRVTQGFTRERMVRQTQAVYENRA